MGTTETFFRTKELICDDSKSLFDDTKSLCDDVKSFCNINAAKQTSLDNYRAMFTYIVNTMLDANKTKGQDIAGSCFLFTFVQGGGD